MRQTVGGGNKGLYKQQVTAFVEVCCVKGLAFQNLRVWETKLEAQVNCLKATSWET